MTLELTIEQAALLRANDKSAVRQLFADSYGALAAIARRYAKNEAQAEDALHAAFTDCLRQLQHVKGATAPVLTDRDVIAACVTYIRNIRSEYYVASTVYASTANQPGYDLFANHELIDFRNIDPEVLVSALQKLVPSQRLIFNLHVIDGYSLEEAAQLLESSVDTARSNLEKARFNLQKNVEKCLNAANYEQSF